MIYTLRPKKPGFYSHLAAFSATGFPACSTKDEFSCGMGILPVPKRLVENGARSQFLPNLRAVIKYPRKNPVSDYLRQN
jgi:hypothetical protein